MSAVMIAVQVPENSCDKSPRIHRKPFTQFEVVEVPGPISTNGVPVAPDPGAVALDTKTVIVPASIPSTVIHMFSWLIAFVHVPEDVAVELLINTKLTIFDRVIGAKSAATPFKFIDTNIVKKQIKL